MRYRVPLTALVVLATLALISAWTLTRAAPVSASQVFERSVAAQQAAQAAEGIRHTRIKTYTNFDALPAPKRGPGESATSLIESYFDPRTGKFRSLTTNAETGALVNAAAFDGTNLYSSQVRKGEAGTVRAIYRTPQGKGVELQLARKGQSDALDEKAVFEAARKDPGAELRGKETWEDGRTVYVIRAQNIQAVKPIGGAESPPMVATLYFDSTTYALLGRDLAVVGDGSETLVYSSRTLLDEILPASSAVAWDLSDLQGVKFIDDPKGELGDQLPVPISAQELAQRVKSAFMLRVPPPGYEMTISAPPNPKPAEPDVYLIEYRNAQGDYVVLQGGMGKQEAPIPNADEVYKTRHGFTLYFQPRGSGDDKYSSALVQAPDGTLFLMNSTTTRQELKQLAEELVPVE